MGAPVEDDLLVRSLALPTHMFADAPVLLLVFRVFWVGGGAAHTRACGCDDEPSGRPGHVWGCRGCRNCCAQRSEYAPVTSGWQAMLAHAVAGSRARRRGRLP
jgi:hypothetical protein